MEDLVREVLQHLQRERRLRPRAHEVRDRRCVFVEGNYLLLRDDSRWAPLMSLWDQVNAPSFLLRDQPR